MLTKIKATDKKFSKKTYNPMSKLTTEEIDKKGWNVKKTFIDPKTAQEILNERNSNPIDRVPQYTNRNLKKSKGMASQDVDDPRCLQPS